MRTAYCVTTKDNGQQEGFSLYLSTTFQHRLCNMYSPKEIYILSNIGT